MAANTTYVKDRIAALLVRSANGLAQFGARDQFRKIAGALGYDSACAWARQHVSITLRCRELLADVHGWLLSDTEATELGEGAEVCELALIRPDGSEAYNSLLRPTVPIAPSSTAIHGITNELASGAPTLHNEYETIARAIQSVKFVGFYNRRFDVRALEQSTYAHGLPELPWIEVIELQELIAPWIGDYNSKRQGWRWPKLEGGHRAKGDCLELLAALRAMATSDVDYVNGLIESERPRQKERVFYRVANIETGQGLWYDRSGNFTGLIHEKFSFCMNSELRMPHDPAIVGWLSATDSLEDLLNWFPSEDIRRLADHGYIVATYKSSDYKMHNGHWVIRQDTAELISHEVDHEWYNLGL